MIKNLKITKTKINVSYEPYYELSIKMDYCDADYIYKNIKISKKEFEDNELYLLVLSYIKDSKYGLRIDENKHFDWINEYLEENDLIAVNDWDRGHSYKYIRIKLYEGDNIYRIDLPSIREIFNNEDEMINYMNNLYEKVYKNVDCSR